jgi:putative restriction endonuclease
VKEPLRDLLIEFGPQRSYYHPEQPFVRLTSDGLWQLNKEVNKRSISDRLLTNEDITGRFPEHVYNQLMNDKHLFQQAAEVILHEHFPDTMHEDILRAVGLEFETQQRRKRDPRFREKILQAYEYSCAICGFNVRLGHNLVGIEAAHIKWHQAGGPDIEDNGIALCSMHHKLFDRGVFTFSEDHKLLVAKQAHGSNGFDEWLMRYHGSKIREPIHPLYKPQDSYINWHTREVFRGPSRYQVSGDL